MTTAPQSLESLLEAAKRGKFTTAEEIAGVWEMGRLTGYAQGIAFAAKAIKAPAAHQEEICATRS